MFSHKKSALLQVVKNGHLVTWPGLMESINQHTFEAHASHHHWAYESKTPTIRSTSKTPITSGIEDVTATPASLGTNTHLVYAVLVDQ
jgi:hypothetical protein